MSITVARVEPSVAGVGDYIELMKLLFAMLLVDRMAGGLLAPLWGHLPTGA